MRVVYILLTVFFLVSCDKSQTQDEIFRLSKGEIFKYLQQNNLVKDSSEIKRITQEIIYPKRDIDAIHIKYYIKDKSDSLWIIHSYREEYLKDEALFIRLSPKLKKIIRKEENKRPAPKYNRMWADGVYEY